MFYPSGSFDSALSWYVRKEINFSCYNCGLRFKLEHQIICKVAISQCLGVKNQDAGVEGRSSALPSHLTFASGACMTDGLLHFDS